MAIQRALHESSLNASTPPVNQAHLAKPRGVRGSDVLLHDIHNLSRGEGVEVQRVFDGHFVHRSKPKAYSASYSATTDVEMPPRAEKSPVTVIRFGLQAATRSSRIWLVTAS